MKSPRVIIILCVYTVKHVTIYNHCGPGGSCLNMEVASLERLKVNIVDSSGLGQVASIERVAIS